jgi:hypothetical protein
MTTHFHTEAIVGDIVVAAFDEAARQSNDPVEISRLATGLVAKMLRHAHRARPARAVPASAPPVLTH